LKISKKVFAGRTTYRVVLANSAKSDAQAIYERTVNAAPIRGPLWFEDLIQAMDSLDHDPLRCPLAREAKKVGRPIRCLLFGKRRHRYRILYEIDPSSRTVCILHIRQGARQDLEAREIGQ
jgi:plasmid stabilization system protein ParE